MADGTQSKLLYAGELLDKKGGLVQSGYAFSQVKNYDRSAIKHKRLRIKEWDYYYFGDETRAIALTVADNSYMSLGSVSVLDFEHLTYITKSKLGWFPKGKLNMPSSCESGIVVFDKGGVRIEFVNDNGTRRLVASFKKFDGKKDFECEIELEPYAGDNITMATPFNKRRQFYYNTKINCLKGNGYFRIGDERHEFESGCGGLDWGRGVWPYKNVWYWSSLSTEIDGKPFGLNLGYGFGKPLGTENTVFYDGKAHKLDRVTFDIPFTLGAIDYLKPWKISDDEEKLQLVFYPIIDRKDKMNVGVLSTDQHQVFGKFYGKATLDDGTVVVIKNKIGFAEHVKNKW
ncbi:MAG: DUF2804 domain-containing protein [Clostridiales bacterium]|nr:DUF2804 domain-containing protein [Clostridiales bacterium]